MEQVHIDIAWDTASLRRLDGGETGGAQLEMWPEERILAEAERVLGPLPPA